MLGGVTLGMLKPLLFRNVRRVFLIMIIGVLLVLFVGLIVGFIATVIPFMAIAFLFVLLVVVVSVPLAIWAPVYLFEDIYIIDALKKAYRLGFATGRYRTDFHCYGIHRRHLAGSDDDSMVYRDYCEIYLCND